MEAVRWVIHPRWTDQWKIASRMEILRDTGDASVFAGVPRVHMPAMDLGQVYAVMHDARLAGRLPPSLQPDMPMGLISKATRTILRRPVLSCALLAIVGTLLGLLISRRGDSNRRTVTKDARDSAKTTR